MNALQEKLAAIAKLNANTYSSTLQHVNTPLQRPPMVPFDVSRGLDLAARPQVDDANTINAQLGRVKGGALWAGLPVSKPPPARPKVAPHAGQSAKDVASSVVSARLREHPNNKKSRPVVGSVFSAAAQPAAHAPAAAGIDKRRLSDTLTNKLQRRPTMEELATRNIIPPAAASGTISVAIADKLQALERQRTTESLEAQLQRRASVDMLPAGVAKHIPQHIAPHAPSAAAATAAATPAPSLDRVFEEEYDDDAPPVAAPAPPLRQRSSSVGETVRKLEKKRTSESLSRHLITRPPLDTLASAGIVADHVASGLSPPLAGSADAVARGLTKRPSRSELEVRGILPPSWATAPGVNPELANAMKAIEKQRCAQSVGHSLAKRPSMDELASKGILKTHPMASSRTAPALQASLAALHKHGTASSLENALRKRPSLDVLAAKGIMPRDPPPPGRVRHLFKKLDTDRSNGLDFEELTIGFTKEFNVAALAPHVMRQMRACFQMAATTDTDGTMSLKINVFSRFYCEVLFRHFDADDSGDLQLAEVAAALKFLTKPNAQGEQTTPVVAYPPEFTDAHGEVHLPISWFWNYFKSMEILVDGSSASTVPASPPHAPEGRSLERQGSWYPPTTRTSLGEAKAAPVATADAPTWYPGALTPSSRAFLTELQVDADAEGGSVDGDHELPVGRALPASPLRQALEFADGRALPASPLRQALEFADGVIPSSPLRQALEWSAAQGGESSPAGKPPRSTDGVPGLPRSPDALREQEASRKQWLDYYVGTQRWDAALSIASGSDEQTHIAASMGEAYSKVADAGAFDDDDEYENANSDGEYDQVFRSGANNGALDYDDDDDDDDDDDEDDYEAGGHVVKGSMFGDKLEDFDLDDDDDDDYEEFEKSGSPTMHAALLSQRHQLEALDEALMRRDAAVTSPPPRAPLEQMATVEELRAKGVLPEVLFSSGLVDRHSNFDADEANEEYEYEVGGGRQDYLDRITVTDLGEDGEEEDDSYDDSEDDDGYDAPVLSVHRDVLRHEGVDISDLPEWLDAHGGGVQPAVTAAMREADEEYDPVTTPRDDYTERAEPPPMDAASSPTRATAPPASIHILRGAAGASGSAPPPPSLPPLADGMDGDEGDRPLLGSPTSGGGLRGLQESLDTALDEMRKEMDKLWAAKAAASGAREPLTNQQRARAQMELDRALGGF